jgi:ceramide glucosyltransferase
MDTLALAVEMVAALLTVCGMVYGLLALWGARDFERATRAGTAAQFAPGVSILKPVKGVDPRMYAGLVSHCLQEYAGPVELVFGVSSLQDEAVSLVARLRVEYHDSAKLQIRLVECPLRLGTNGKVSNLAQMLPFTSHDLVVVNDSDILVSPQYLQKVVAAFAERPSPANATNQKVGLVTVPYVGTALGGVWSRLEALGISTDFVPGVLTARKLEGGIRFGLGSTLATTKTALAAIGGFEALVDQLADDYEMGVRMAGAGYRVELAREVVATTVPAYTLRGFCDHQLRWARSTRDSRRKGYFGLGVTFMLPWVLAAVLASGFALWSFSLLSLALLVRVAVAMVVGVGILRDGQVLRDIWLLPLRDCFGLFFWAWSYASDVVVWRGEQFRLRRGELQRIEDRGVEDRG